jgi:hypothetical protein
MDHAIPILFLIYVFTPGVILNPTDFLVGTALYVAFALVFPSLPPLAPFSTTLPPISPY